MALIIEAPSEVYSLENNKNFKLFLAGGITDCPDWQSVVIDGLKDLPLLTIYNPRRANFPIDDPSASETQITWEYNHLRDSDLIIYWFSKGSINPIVLYELGKWGDKNDRPVFIGIDKEYTRMLDVEIQTKLANPNAPIVYSLKDLIESVKDYLKNTIE